MRAVAFEDRAVEECFRRSESELVGEVEVVKHEGARQRGRREPHVEITEWGRMRRGRTDAYRCQDDHGGETSQRLHGRGDHASAPPLRASAASRIPRTCASVSASSAFLSVRQRSIRGNRTAMPDRWRLDAARPSNPSSNTWTGSTWRTGPKRSRVCRRIHLSSSAISSFESPE